MSGDIVVVNFGDREIANNSYERGAPDRLHRPPNADLGHRGGGELANVLARELWLKLNGPNVINFEAARRSAR